MALEVLSDTCSCRNSVLHDVPKAAQGGSDCSPKRSALSRFALAARHRRECVRPALGASARRPAARRAGDSVGEEATLLRAPCRRPLPSPSTACAKAIARPSATEAPALGVRALQRPQGGASSVPLLLGASSPRALRATRARAPHSVCTLGRRRSASTSIFFKHDFRLNQRRFVTMVVDHKNNRLMEVVEGKDGRRLARRARAHPRPRERTLRRARPVRPYRSFARSFFPNAQLVADKFHVLRLISPPSTG